MGALFAIPFLFCCYIYSKMGCGKKHHMIDPKYEGIFDKKKNKEYKKQEILEKLITFSF
jgi:hypothetical protein